MPSPILILAAVLVLALSNAYSYMSGSKHESARWAAKITAERLAATEQARATEKTWQEAANAAAKQHQTQIAGVRRNLDIALDGLRNRPERPINLPATARTGCEGGSGAGLYREDGEFLAREAARADEIRAGLAACYTYADTLK